MLDSFLEQRIIIKQNIFHILLDNDSIDLFTLSHLLNTSEKNTKYLIDCLCNEIPELKILKKDRDVYCMELPNFELPFEVLYPTYRTSGVLQCLKFFITNHDHHPFSKFSLEQHYSLANAYRIKEKCQNYLAEIGLSIKNNFIFGEEYRIRYLIALLDYKYGIDCGYFDSHSRDLARNFICQTNKTINKEFLDLTREKYGYFENLLILSWKRKQYSPFIEIPNDLKLIQKLFVFDLLNEYVQKYIENPLNINYDESDYYYVFLIYCTSNCCVFADRWNDERIAEINRLLLNIPNLKDLREKIEAKYGKEVADNRMMKITLFTFFKHMILNLEGIIPDKWDCSQSNKTAITEIIAKQMHDLLDHWRSDNNIKYRFEDSKLYFISYQIKTIIRQLINPIKIITISDLILDLETIEYYFMTNYPKGRVEFQSLLLNAKSLEILNEADDTIIIINKKFQSILDHLSINNSNQIVLTSIDFNKEDRTKIAQLIVEKQEEEMIKYLAKL